MLATLEIFLMKQLCLPAMVTRPVNLTITITVNQYFYLGISSGQTE